MENNRRRRRRRRKVEEFTFRSKRRTFNKYKFFRSLFQWFLLVLIAAVMGYAFVSFCFQTVQVVGPSMSDSLKDGQVVVVNKMAYTFGEVERFDIIAFSKVDANEYFEIKRVIGLPKERVLIKDGEIYINDERLEDLPFDERILTSGLASEEVVLGDNEYFVLGDNVNNSEDSRFTNVGNISKSEILGKVVRILSPREERGKVE